LTAVHLLREAFAPGRRPNRLWPSRAKGKGLRHRPEADIARIVYASTLTDPNSEYWLAQSYSESLKAYDYVVIMAYPLHGSGGKPNRLAAGARSFSQVISAGA
jgi:hypothetical protein